MFVPTWSKCNKRTKFYEWIAITATPTISSLWPSSSSLWWIPWQSHHDFSPEPPSPSSEEEDVYNDPNLALPFPNWEEATQTLTHDFSATLSIPHVPTSPSPTPTNCQPPPFSQPPVLPPPPPPLSLSTPFPTAMSSSCLIELWLGASKNFNGDSAKATSWLNSLFLSHHGWQDLQDQCQEDHIHAVLHDQGLCPHLGNYLLPDCPRHHFPSFGTWTDFEAKFKQTFELSNAVTTLIQWLSIHYLQENASTVEVATYVSEFKNHTQISGITANITLIGYFSVGILIKLMKQIYSMVLQYGWIPILFPLYMTHMRPSDKSSRKNGMISHMITPRLIHFSFHYLVNDSLSWTELRSRSADLYLWYFPFGQTITSDDTSPYCYNPFSSSFHFTFHSYSLSTYLER